MKQPDKQRTPEELKAIETALCQVRDSIEKYLITSVAAAWAYAEKPPEEGDAPSTIHRYFFDKSGRARVVARPPEIWPPLPLPLPREPVAGVYKTDEMRAYVGEWAVNEVMACAPILISDDARTYECRRDTIGPLLASCFPVDRRFTADDSKQTICRWALEFLCMDTDMDHILQGALLCANPWQLKGSKEVYAKNPRPDDTPKDDEGQTFSDPGSKENFDSAEQSCEDAEAEKSEEVVSDAKLPPKTDTETAASSTTKAEAREKCLADLVAPLREERGYAEILAELAFADRLLADTLHNRVGVRELEALMVTLLRDKANVWKALRHLACLKSVSAKTLRCRGGDLLGTLEKLKQHYDGAADKNETKATGQEEAEAAGKEEATVTGQEENVATGKPKKKRGPYSGPAFDKLCVSVKGGVEPLHKVGRFPSVEGPIEQGIRFNDRKDPIKKWLKERHREAAALALAAIDGKDLKGTHRGKPVFGTPFLFFPETLHAKAEEAETTKADSAAETSDRTIQVEAVLQILENVGNLPTLPSAVDALRAKLLEYPTKGWEELKVALLLPGLARHYAREYALSRRLPEETLFRNMRVGEGLAELRRQILDDFPDTLLEETRPKADTRLATDQENRDALRDDQHIHGPLSTEGTSYDDFIQEVMVDWHVNRRERAKNKQTRGTEETRGKKSQTGHVKEWNLREALWKEEGQRSEKEATLVKDFEEDWDRFKRYLKACLTGQELREELKKNKYFVAALRHFFLCFSRHYPRYYANVVSSEEHFRTERELEELKGGKEVNHEH